MMKEEQLKMYDIVLLIDKSGSMEEPMGGGNTKTRWETAQKQTMTWARQAQKWDEDGISVGFFNNKFQIYPNVTPDKVKDIFKEHTPNSSTDTHKPLEHLFEEYIKNGKKKPMLIFVVTDGAATNPDALAKAIANVTQKMDADEEIGIQFLRIGDDPQAKELCEFLDDNLVTKYKAKFDIVDTSTFEEASEMDFRDLCEKTLND